MPKMLMLRAAVLAAVVGAIPASAQPVGGGPGPGPVPNPWVVNGGTLSYDKGGLDLTTTVPGGDKGPGTINVSGGYYVNGVKAVGSGFVAWGVPNALFQLNSATPNSDCQNVSNASTYLLQYSRNSTFTAPQNAYFFCGAFLTTNTGWLYTNPVGLPIGDNSLHEWFGAAFDYGLVTSQHGGPFYDVNGVNGSHQVTGLTYNSGPQTGYTGNQVGIQVFIQAAAGGVATVYACADITGTLTAPATWGATALTCDSTAFPRASSNATPFSSGDLFIATTQGAKPAPGNPLNLAQENGGLNLNYVLDVHDTTNGVQYYPSQGAQIFEENIISNVKNYATGSISFYYTSGRIAYASQNQVASTTLNGSINGSVTSVVVNSSAGMPAFSGTCSITGFVLNCSVVTGTILPGEVITSTAGTNVVASFGSGTGGAGTYELSLSQTAANGAVTGSATFYAWIDSEVVLDTTGSTSTTRTVLRGQQGTLGASHASGAIYGRAPYGYQCMTSQQNQGSVFGQFIISQCMGRGIFAATPTAGYYVDQGYGTINETTYYGSNITGTAKSYWGAFSGYDFALYDVNGGPVLTVAAGSNQANLSQIQVNGFGIIYANGSLDLGLTNAGAFTVCKIPTGATGIDCNEIVVGGLGGFISDGTHDLTIFNKNGATVCSIATGVTTFNCGPVTATSFNGLAITTTTGTLTVASGKTLTDTSGVGASILIGSAGGGFTAFGGVSCTNQFVRSLSAGGSGACATVANSDLANSTITLNAGASFGMTAPGAMTLGSTYTFGATTDNLRFNGLGLGAAAPTFAGQISSALGANSLTAIQIKRFTDTSPTGNFENYANAASTPVWTLDITGTVTVGTWHGTVVGGTYGGTGVNNGSSTLTLGGSLTTTGAGAPTLGFGSSAVSYNFPGAVAAVSGTPTLLSTAGLVSSATPANMSLNVTRMGGAGGTCTFTPKYSTRAHVTFLGLIQNDTSGFGNEIQLNYGTGTAPVAGAAVTGTQFASAIGYGGTGYVANQQVPFYSGGNITGLTPGTAYWFDAVLIPVGGGTAAFANVTCSFNEI